jgi:hypothetical protein
MWRASLPFLLRRPSQFAIGGKSAGVMSASKKLRSEALTCGPKYGTKGSGALRATGRERARLRRGGGIDRAFERRQVASRARRLPRARCLPRCRGYHASSPD